MAAVLETRLRQAVRDDEEAVEQLEGHGGNRLSALGLRFNLTGGGAFSTIPS
jgi:hypothetical protein